MGRTGKGYNGKKVVARKFFRGSAKLSLKSAASQQNTQEALATTVPADSARIKSPSDDLARSLKFADCALALAQGVTTAQKELGMSANKEMAELGNRAGSNMGGTCEKSQRNIMENTQSSVLNFRAVNDSTMDKIQKVLFKEEEPEPEAFSSVGDGGSARGQGDGGSASSSDDEAMTE